MCAREKRGEEGKNGVKREITKTETRETQGKIKRREGRSSWERDREKPTKYFVSTDHWQSNELLKWLPVYLGSHPKYLICLLCFFFFFQPMQHNDPKVVMSCSSYLNQPMGFPGCHWLPWMLKRGSQSQQVRHMSPFHRDLITHYRDVMRDIWGKEMWRKVARYLTPESGVSCDFCGVERKHKRS